VVLYNSLAVQSHCKLLVKIKEVKIITFLFTFIYLKTTPVYNQISKHRKLTNTILNNYVNARPINVRCYIKCLLIFNILKSRPTVHFMFYRPISFFVKIFIKINRIQIIIV